MYSRAHAEPCKGDVKFAKQTHFWQHHDLSIAFNSIKGAREKGNGSFSVSWTKTPL